MHGTDCSNVSTNEPPFDKDNDGAPINRSFNLATVHVDYGLDPLRPSFVGFVVDSVNATGGLTGKMGFPAAENVTFDWGRFENPYRIWNQYSTAAYANITFGRDKWTTGMGGIFDVRLRKSDNVLLNHSGDVTKENRPFIADAPCPADLDGDNTATDRRTDVSTYLLHAMELILDGFGDDDGLCESNEHCLYTPNIGAYQGHGSFWNHTCDFKPGTVSGVTIYAHPENGVDL
jgi:hypothetical protein